MLAVELTKSRMDLSEVGAEMAGIGFCCIIF